MNKKELAKEIISFCVKYKIKGFPKEIDKAIIKVEDHLKYSWFIEYLIHTLLTETKYIENVDKKQLEELIIKLEKARLDLEYDE